MALTNLVKLPKSVCKHVKIYPPTAVICFAHSQLAALDQACNVEKPIIFFLEKGKKLKSKSISEKKFKDAQGKLELVHHDRGKASLLEPDIYQSVNAMWECVRTLEMHQNLANKSLLSKWSRDPLIDHKQLVLLVFDQDKLSNKPCLSKKNISSLHQGEDNLPSKKNAEKVKNERMCPRSHGESCKVPIQVSVVNSQSISRVSYSRLSEVNSVAKATVLCAENNTKSDMKKEYKLGPDATQLSSVLLHLREEIPEFFLKTPNYSMYHQNVKFVNNIIGATTNGIYQYKAQISGFRFMILTCMTELSLDVLKISKHSDEGAIKVRWRIKGIPLLIKYLPYLGRQVRDGENRYRYLDGFSVFEVGSDGLIHCHRLHKVMPSSSLEKESPLWMVFLAPFFHVLDSNSCESFSAFECRSTDKEIESGIQV